jgi:hypothetical protein
MINWRFLTAETLCRSLYFLKKCFGFALEQSYFAYCDLLSVLLHV